MGSGQRSNRKVVPQAQQALDNLKYSTAREIGVNVPATDYWGDLSSRDCGAVGGHMVRKMISFVEQSMASGGATTGFAGRMNV